MGKRYIVEEDDGLDIEGFLGLGCCIMTGIIVLAIAQAIEASVNRTSQALGCSTVPPVAQLETATEFDAQTP